MRSLTSLVNTYIDRQRSNNDLFPRLGMTEIIRQIVLFTEITSDLILGFEQVSYSGSIAHGNLDLEPIMLIEGFTEQVSFTLLGGNVMWC